MSLMNLRVQVPECSIEEPSEYNYPFPIHLLSHSPSFPEPYVNHTTYTQLLTLPKGPCLFQFVVWWHKTDSSSLAQYLLLVLSLCMFHSLLKLFSAFSLIFHPRCHFLGRNFQDLLDHIVTSFTYVKMLRNLECINLH